jgi:hypothetical protein
VSGTLIIFKVWDDPAGYGVPSLYLAYFSEIADGEKEGLCLIFHTPEDDLGIRKIEIVYEFPFN